MDYKTLKFSAKKGRTLFFEKRHYKGLYSDLHDVHHLLPASYSYFRQAFDLGPLYRVFSDYKPCLSSLSKKVSVITDFSPIA